MNPYQQFVADIAARHQSGKDFPLGGFDALPRPETAPGAPTALIFSPHPDDECIIGGLAFRLLRQSGWKVANVAVTQGSNKERQAARLEELKGACHYLGFDLIQTAENGLERIHPKTRESDPEHWQKAVAVIAGILEEHSPRAILFPHDRDWNSTHIGVNRLLCDALAIQPDSFSCATVETEFWGAMDDPNLLVESSPEDLGNLITALSFHVGEVRRNPYHLLTAAWMQDNVRRGGELVGGQGEAPPQFTFATCYRLRRWANGRFGNVLERGRFLAAGDDPAALLG